MELLLNKNFFPHKGSSAQVDNSFDKAAAKILTEPGKQTLKRQKMKEILRAKKENTTEQFDLERWYEFLTTSVIFWTKTPNTLLRSKTENIRIIWNLFRT